MSRGTQIHGTPSWRLALQDTQSVGFSTMVAVAVTFTRDELALARANAHAFAALVSAKQAAMHETLSALIAGAAIADLAEDALHR